jgi:hypothetical protein
MDTKKCTKCKEIKELNMFGKNNKNKSGYKYWCKSCGTNKQRERRLKEKESDPEKYHQKWADYYAKTKEHNYSIKKSFLEIPENRQKRNEYIRKYKAEKRLKDKGYVLYENLRKRIWHSVKDKSNSSKDILGCDIDNYLNWINHTMFKDMSWKNYGIYWNIDHLIPISKFDLSDPNEVKKAFNWKNTWAMIASENFKKRNKINEEETAKHTTLLNTFLKNNNYEIGNQQPSSQLKRGKGSETR